jgi:hypothetical protein
MIGGNQDATDQTLWGLVNATTEYIDHEKGRMRDNRLNAAAGLDYVSCSPFRVPIARLAAAQAAIDNA